MWHDARQQTKLPHHLLGAVMGAATITHGYPTRTATDEEFRAAWKADGEFADEEIEGWIEHVRDDGSGFMTFPDGAKWIRKEADRG